MKKATQTLIDEWKNAGAAFSVQNDAGFDKNVVSLSWRSHQISMIHIAADSSVDDLYMEVIRVDSSMGNDRAMLPVSEAGKVMGELIVLLARLERIFERWDSVQFTQYGKFNLSHNGKVGATVNLYNDHIDYSIVRPRNMLVTSGSLDQLEDFTQVVMIKDEKAAFSAEANFIDSLHFI